MTKRKKIRVRFYQAGVGASAAYGNLVERLSKAKDGNNMTPPIEVDGRTFQVRGVLSSSDGSYVRGYLVKFHDEAPLTGSRDRPEEELVRLNDGQELIERNHFILYREPSGVEILAFEASAEGSHVTHLSRYLTLLFGASETVCFPDILTKDAFAAIQNGALVKAIEFRVAKPKSKRFAPDPDDTWTKESIQFMDATGATTFSAKIATKSHNKGLIEESWNMVKRLLKSKQTRKLRVTVSDRDNPIDLLAERVYEDIYVERQEKHVASSDVFAAVSEAKALAKAQLDEIFGLGDEVLL